MRSDPRPSNAEASRDHSVRPLCEVLEWDSAFFGRRIGRINSRSLDVARAGEVEAWIQQHAIECVYFLADPTDVATESVLRGRGYRLIDIRVTLERLVGESTVLHSSPPIRGWKHADVSRLRAIAARSHRQTRFYQDGHFSRSRCDELYATWIERSCFGYADHVLVAESDSSVVGYVSLHRENARRGRIGLLAVDSAAQGLGFGQALVRAALSWFGAHDVVTVEVATQAGNSRAASFYARCGFEATDVQHWYHWWPIAKADPQGE